MLLRRGSSFCARLLRSGFPSPGEHPLWAPLLCRLGAGFDPHGRRTPQSWQPPAPAGVIGVAAQQFWPMLLRGSSFRSISLLRTAYFMSCPTPAWYGISAHTMFSSLFAGRFAQLQGNVTLRAHPLPSRPSRSLEDGGGPWPGKKKFCRF